MSKGFYLTYFKEKVFFFFKCFVEMQCSRTLVLSFASSDCDISIRMFSYEHSTHTRYLRVAIPRPFKGFIARDAN